MVPVFSTATVMAVAATMAVEMTAAYGLFYYCFSVVMAAVVNKLTNEGAAMSYDSLL